MSAFAQNKSSLQGDWKGAITIQGNPLPITTHFTADDSLAGTIDIQGAMLPLQNIRTTETDSVYFQFTTNVNVARFKGRFTSDSTITGNYYQAGQKFSFKLKRDEPKANQQNSNDNTSAKPSINSHNSALIGDWKGTLEANAPLLIKTHFHKQGDGLKGTFTIQSNDLPLQHIEVTDDDSVHFEFQSGNGLATFKGFFKNDSSIVGNFRQSGYTFPFKLHRFEPDTMAKQAEKKHLPYHHKDLIIKNESIDVGGTLTWPETGQANQLVIMISGSGAQNRDEEIYGFKPFAQIADYMTRNGIATFRFDDRGIGESGGDPNVGLNELTKDVQVIYDALSARSELSGASIGLLGHSQGGYISIKLAAKNPNIGFIVLMSGPSFPLDDIILQQTEAIEKGKGTPDSLIQKGINEQRALFKAIREEKLDSLRKAKIVETEAELAKLPEQKKEEIGDLHAYATQQLNSQIAQVELPIFQSMIQYDPIQDIQKLQLPVLALFGEKDLQVLQEPNADRIAKALKKSDADYTIKIIENANHFFQKAETGLPSEYASLKKEFVDGFLEAIEQWIKK